MLQSRLQSFRHAFRGVVTLISEQPNARIHLLATVLVIALGYYFDIARIEWMAISLSIGLVWMAEALNTALEYLCDAVHPEHHALIKKAKDVAAAGVLLAAIAAAIVGVLVFVA